MYRSQGQFSTKYCFLLMLVLKCKEKEGSTMEKYYTPEEVAELLKVSRETVYNWLRAGKLKGTKIFNFWRITESELNRLLKGNEQNGRNADK